MTSNKAFSYSFSSENNINYFDVHHENERSTSSNLGRALLIMRPAHIIDELEDSQMKNSFLAANADDVTNTTNTTVSKNRPQRANNAKEAGLSRPRLSLNGNKKRRMISTRAHHADCNPFGLVIFFLLMILGVSILLLLSSIEFDLNNEMEFLAISTMATALTRIEEGAATDGGVNVDMHRQPLWRKQQPKQGQVQTTVSSNEEEDHSIHSIINHEPAQLEQPEQHQNQQQQQVHKANNNKIIRFCHKTTKLTNLEWFGIMFTGYSLSLLIGGSACLTACCAGQFGCLALQAAMLDLMIVFPLNFALFVLYWVLTPLRFAWRHLLTWFVVPFVSIFHMRPSFRDSGLDKFVLAVPFAFRLLGMDNIYDTTERNVRREMRRVVQKYFPRITSKNIKCCCPSSPIPDVVLTNTLFRLMLGFALFPLAWWLCDEMYCVPLTHIEDTSTSCFDKILNKLKCSSASSDNDSESSKAESKPGEQQQEGNEENHQQEDEEVIENEDEEDTTNKQLEVKFVFPKCRFLLEARKTYGDRIQGNKVCRRVCRLLIEELTGQVLGHQWKVEPNMRTMRCTFSITTKPFEAPPVNDSTDDLEAFSGGCKCQDKSLEW